MKHNSMKGLWLILFTIVGLTFGACKKDDDNPIDLVPNLNGLYVYGTNTVAKAPGNAASKMNLAVLDPSKGTGASSSPGIFGKFIHIGANSTISLAFKDNDIARIYGSPDGGRLDSATLVGGAVKDLVINGELENNGDPIEVTKAGLYYLYVDINTETFILMEVKANIIGDATEAQWAAGTAIPLKSSDSLSTVFEVTNLPLRGATGYRYRFNDGWHVYYIDPIATLSSMGVPSYGEAWDTGINNIGFHLDNAPHKETGYFTLTLTYDSRMGTWSESKVKTGDLLTDYSNTQIGWFGNAYYVSGTTEGAWDAIHHIKTPVKEGNLYHWDWTLDLIQGRSFVLREEGGTGAWITFGGAAKLGAAFDNGLIIKEAPEVDNYFVQTGGSYNVRFTINAEDEGRILTINPN